MEPSQSSRFSVQPKNVTGTHFRLWVSAVPVQTCQMSFIMPAHKNLAIGRTDYLNTPRDVWNETIQTNVRNTSALPVTTSCGYFFNVSTDRPMLMTGNLAESNGV